MSCHGAPRRRPPPIFSRRALVSALLFPAALTVMPLAAAPPVLEHLHPAGAHRGTTNTVSLAGKFDPWPPWFWSDPPGLEITAQTNKGKIDLIIPADATPGPRLVRAFNAEGASEPRIFVVGDSTELTDVEPNNRFDRAQRIESLPVTLNGRLDRAGDVDSFAVTLSAGQWLTARVDAYVLFSKMDGLLRLVTTNGLQLAWNHDFRTVDPRLILQAPSNGTYVIQTMAFPFPANAEVRLAGGEAYVYRLHLATATSPPSLTDCPVGRPPSDSPVELPLLHAACLSQAGEIHRYRFNARKGEVFRAEASAASIGSPADLWLAVENSDGKELTRADDAPHTPDPRLEWTAPADGEYRIAIGNLLARGGPLHLYELAIRPLPPDVEAKLGATSVAVTAGQTNTVKLTVNRLRGYTNQLSLQFSGLPEGVSVSPLDVPEKGGEMVLNVVASDDAVPTNTLLRVTVREPAGETARTVAAELTSSTVDNGVPGGFTELLVPAAEGLWLTVRQKPEEKEAAAAPVAH